jgi:hypothetical protein
MYNDEFKSNEPKFTITIDPRPVTSKPRDDYKETITSHLTLQTGITINEFSTLVSQPLGYTWSPGLFKGTRSNHNWQQQSVFALDFDSGITIDQVLDRCQQFCLAPQVWYSTFSDSPAKQKFRVVFFLSEPVTDPKLFEFLIESLLRLFPEADQSCKDAGRFFFGGLDSVVINTDPIPTSQFIDALSINTITRDSSSFRKLPLESSYYTRLKSAEKREILYNIYRSSRFPANEITPPPNSVPRGLTEKFDFEQARQKVRIFREFLDGRWLTHMELFGLATNLVHIKGGIKLMKEMMIKFNQLGITHYTQNNFNILSYVKKVNYSPQPIYKFSPFEEDDDLLDLVSATKDIRGFIEVLEPNKKIDLKEAEDLLESSYRDVIENGETGKIYLFKLPTAIGKTQIITGTRAIIAAPTNSLKNEIGERMGVKYIKTPDSVIFEDEKINKKLEHYYSIGLPKKSMRILNHMVNPVNSKMYSANDVITANQYLQDLRYSMTSQDTILTTHKRALFTDFNHDTIIFDEDPLNSILEIKELKISDLVALNLVTNLNGLDYLINHLTGSTPTQIIKTPSFAIDIDELIDVISDLKVDSNIVDFLRSSYFIRDGLNPDIINYIVKRDLPKNKKVIIMSATLPVHIYQKLFGDRVEVIDITNVNQQGTVIQYTNRSCSRNGLNNYVHKISEKVGDKPVLTFKSFRHHFQNPVKEMYFGNCSGYDSLKGQDMAVVGTPHRNNIEYFLTASILGIDYKSTDTTMSHQKIEYNGFRFKFNCFDNEELRNIQLSLIESDLIQAVGRARTLRTSAQVDLYSNFPLKISDEFRY